jgi:hypothetical protein
MIDAIALARAQGLTAALPELERRHALVVTGRTLVAAPIAR